MAPRTALCVVWMTFAAFCTVVHAARMQYNCVCTDKLLFKNVSSVSHPLYTGRMCTNTCVVMCAIQY